MQHRPNWRRIENLYKSKIQGKKPDSIFLIRSKSGLLYLVLVLLFVVSILSIVLFLIDLNELILASQYLNFDLTDWIVVSNFEFLFFSILTSAIFVKIINKLEVLVNQNNLKIFFFISLLYF